MQTTNGIRTNVSDNKVSNVIRQTTYKQVYNFFKKKGYVICSVTPLANSENWFAVLTNKKDFILATLFVQGKEIEGYEAKVM